MNKTCFEPTVLMEVPAAARAMSEELFGPVVCVSSFADLDSAITLANGVSWQFQASIYTSDLDRALKAGLKLHASAVMINESTSFRVDWMPFRGDGPSGFGTGGIGFSIKDLIREKMLVMKSAEVQF